MDISYRIRPWKFFLEAWFRMMHPIFRKHRRLQSLNPIWATLPGAEHRNVLSPNGATYWTCLGKLLSS